MTRTDVLKRFIGAALTYCSYEKQDMIFALQQLEPRTRAKLVTTYGADQAWRGLARNDFLMMYDSLTVLEHLVENAA